MKSAKDPFISVRARLVQLFEENCPDLDVSALIGETEVTAAVEDEEALDDHGLPEDPALNPKDREAAEKLRSMFKEYTDFRDVPVGTIPMLIDHMSEVLHKFDVRRPDFWDDLLKNPQQITTLLEESESEEV